MCAQLQYSSVVLRPGRRGPKSAPIIDRLCARIRSATFAKLGSATAAAQGCAGYRKPAATMPTDPHPGPSGAANFAEAPGRDDFALDDDGAQQHEEAFLEYVEKFVNPSGDTVSLTDAELPMSLPSRADVDCVHGEAR